MPTNSVCAQCGRPLEERAEPRGRKRLYCDATCRVAYNRARRSSLEWYPLAEAPAQPPTAASTRLDAEALAALLEDREPATGERQLERAILDAWTLAALLDRLGSQTTKEWGWRASGLALAIRDALRRWFEGTAP